MRTHITATGRTGQQLPATGGVHAHSHHRGWQEERTGASNERSACALAPPLLAEKTNLKKRWYQRSCKRINGTTNGCQQREECMRTRITVAGRENKPEKKMVSAVRQ